MSSPRGAAGFRKEFTAIFALSDTMAVIRPGDHCGSGQRVPEDYSVKAGFDGIELCSYYNPTLTTIRQPIQHIAEASVKLLFDILAGRSGHQHKVFAGELLEQESTAKDDNKAQHIPVRIRNMLCCFLKIFEG